MDTIKSLGIHARSCCLLFMMLLLATSGTATAAEPICLKLQQNAGARSQFLEDGNVAFNGGDMARAEAAWKTLRRCTSGTPEWPKAVFNLGLLENRRSNFSQAIAYFSEVLQSHPDDKEPGGNIMETNRNYSNRSALAISLCYERMADYPSALHYAWLAKTTYRYYSWCGTCLNGAQFALNKRIAYLTIRALRVDVWGGMLLIGLVPLGWRRFRKRRAHRQSDTSNR